MRIKMCKESVLDEIKKDCLTLKKQGYLTEYGEGQLDLIQVIRYEDEN